jgi:hypothetical protein
VIPYDLRLVASCWRQGLVRELSSLPKDPLDPNSYSIVLSELGNGYDTLMEAAALLEQAAFLIWQLS